MRTKILKVINYLLTLLIGPLAMTACYVKYGVSPEILPEYGCPYAEFEVTGKVMDQDSMPVNNIRVTVHHDGALIMPEAYSAEDGRYAAFFEAAMPADQVEIIAHDTAGVYESDTVRNIHVTYTGGDGGWNVGHTSLEQDFILKKK